MADTQDKEMKDMLQQDEQVEDKETTEMLLDKGEDDMVEVLQKDAAELGPEANSKDAQADSVSLGTQGATVTFCNIDYKIALPGGGRKLCCRKRGYDVEKPVKNILNNVSGIFPPGMNAIMGPTGGGKSSLLDVLAGRKDPSGLNGQVLVDGKKQPKNFKCMSGYVEQDDIVMGTLTVKENITMSANLRLPESMSAEDKEKRVEYILGELGLEHCADSRVGDEFVRGISGGERKRTCIGMELIISPAVLFLDEPTTGLDANTAHSVMDLLQRISARGRTVIFSIHQPRYSIYRLFDRITLLSRGHTIYHGKCSETIDYFGTLGFKCEEFNNPPDFFLDVIIGHVKTDDALFLDDSVEKSCANSVHSVHSAVDEVDTADEKNAHMKITLSHGVSQEEIDKKIDDMTDKLKYKFINSKWAAQMQTDIEEVSRDGAAVEVKEPERLEYAVGFRKQLYYLCKRTTWNIFRNRQSSMMPIVLFVILSLITGFIFLRLDTAYPNGLQNRTGAFFLITTNTMFGSLALSIRLFMKERAIFIHEQQSGYYRTSAYFLSKICCDVIPVKTITTILQCIITYFMIGLQLDIGKIAMFTLTNWLVGMAGATSCLAISASMAEADVANQLVLLCNISMMLFAGLLVNIMDIPIWLSWLRVFSIVRYGVNALSIVELNDMEFCNTDTERNSTMCYAGAKYLENQGIPHKSSWDLWSNHMVIAIICLACMFIAYLKLRFMKKYK